MPTSSITPAVLEYSGFAAYVTGRSMSDFVKSPAMATEIMSRALSISKGITLHSAPFHIS